MTSNAGLLQPSSSSLATAIAAAYNIVGAHRAAGGVINPVGIGGDYAKKWATLVAECAQIIHSKVTETSGGAA